MSFMITAIVGVGVAATAATAKLGMALAGRQKRIQEQKDAKEEMEARMEDYESLDDIPGEIGEKIRYYERDLQGVKDGTFTQKDYTEKYGSGDATNPLNKASFNPATLNDDDRQGLENTFAGELAHAIGGTTPQESQAAKWYANLGNTGTNQFQFSFANELATAKAKQASILGNPSAIGQLAVNQSPYYDFLKKNKLDRGIL